MNVLPIFRDVPQRIDSALRARTKHCAKTIGLIRISLTMSHHRHLQFTLILPHIESVKINFQGGMLDVL